MKANTRTYIGLFVLGLLSCITSAYASLSSKTVEQVRETVSALAFDPTSFFRRGEMGDSSMLRIIYTGDDYGWPVFSIAVAEGCIDGEKRSDGCGLRLRARMVRAPAPPDMTRPRARGQHLLQLLAERRATSRSAISSNLRPLGVEWLEADLKTCPGIEEIMASSADLIWIPREISTASPQKEILLVLHADTVQVVFDQHQRRSTYEGYIAEGSPAAWAVDLATALEPCWKPAETAPPWHD